MKYRFLYEQPAQQFVQIELTIQNISSDVYEVQLPAWRPGRYELGNFAKNIQQWDAFAEDGAPLFAKKVTKDRWRIQMQGHSTLVVKYNYYAAELNAGSTWMDEKQLYVNPVNCCLYGVDRLEETCEVEIAVPYPYEVATSMTKVGDNTFQVDSFHELADSPFIASPDLQSLRYEVSGTQFYIWFQGEIKANWAKLELDFEAFTRKQMDAFGSFPSEVFHFLFQITPYKTYHGVEHTKSTVIALGPSYDIMGKLYTELLGVSSHELYHAWNIKTIRPAEMWPYDYTRENYATTGYVYEGVTTYMGDQFLLRSGVFDDAQWFTEIGNYITRHLHNGGRLNLSVAESSFDTWLDGYVAGIPNRKTSIYTEGCLFSLLLDVAIIEASKGVQSLDDVMNMLYAGAQEGIPYSAEEYEKKCVELGGEKVTQLFAAFVHQPGDMKDALKDAFQWMGLMLQEKPSPSWSRRFGLKGVYEKGAYKVMNIASGSDATALVVNDKVLAINGYKINDDLDKWMEYFGPSDIELTIDRNGVLVYVNTVAQFENGFADYAVQFAPEQTPDQKKNYDLWKRK